MQLEAESSENPKYTGPLHFGFFFPDYTVAMDMVIQMSPRMVSLVSLSALVFFLVAAKAWVEAMLRRAKLSKLPLLRVRDDGDIMQEGYDRYRDEIHKIETPEGMCVGDGIASFFLYSLSPTSSKKS